MLGTDKEPGIYVRTLNDLFRAIEDTSDDMQYSVTMSYLEVRTVRPSVRPSVRPHAVPTAADVSRTGPGSNECVGGDSVS